MPDTLTATELRAELTRRVRGEPPQDIDQLAALFLDIAGGKYVTGKRWCKSRRNRTIRDLYDGSNLTDLSQLFHLSTRQVRRIAGQK